MKKLYNLLSMNNIINSLYLKNIFRLIIKLLFILILYQLCRALFYYYNSHYFPEIFLNEYIRIIKGSLRFDISAVLYVNSVVILLTIIPSKLLLKEWYKKIIYYIFMMK